MTRPKRGRVQGPLATYAAAFLEELAGSSYAVRSAEAHLLLMARLSRWLGQVPLDPGDLGPAQVDEFLSWNHAEGYRFPKSARVPCRCWCSCGAGAWCRSRRRLR
jgi:hypothetical protein